MSNKFVITLVLSHCVSASMLLLENIKINQMRFCSGNYSLAGKQTVTWTNAIQPNVSMEEAGEVVGIKTVKTVP